MQCSSSSSVPTEATSDTTRSDEDPLCLDPHTILRNTDNNTVHIELHILLHPTYSIPCPYVKAWRHNGVTVSETELTSLLTRTGMNPKPLSSLNTVNGTEDTDYRIYNFGTFVLDVHPILDAPYYTFHICDLSNRIQPLIESHLNGNSTNGDVQLNGSTYMLLWLTYVGPYIGISISPSLFIELQTWCNN
ncbi:hypothetical protein EON65_37300 [archaeon]|nr:MAG: hypothetical protein EON65_37300 [archaeon]